jgi:uracil-DNA glycosylase
MPPIDASHLPADWRSALSAELAKPYWAALESFVADERRSGQVFPPPEEVFTAFHLTPFAAVRVVLLGQDPYHDDGQAHGLCFSVKPGVPPPPSLKNLYKELESDLGCTRPQHGHLAAWAAQGILMLNAVLTVRAHAPASHADRGWETFTDAAIRAVSDRAEPAVFLLWGGYARKKKKLIDATRHAIIEGAHPSPLSAKLFFGSRPFSQVNAALARLGQAPIDWQLPTR